MTDKEEITLLKSKALDHVECIRKECSDIAHEIKGGYFERVPVMFAFIKKEAINAGKTLAKIQDP